MSTPELFPGTKPPRARPRVLMHVSDAADCHTGAEADMGKPMCVMRCTKCSQETEWLIFETATEAKRGIPCPTCN
jgi:DNA-directed RNA polymerase subunit RPC12/RpoP